MSRRGRTWHVQSEVPLEGAVEPRALTNGWLEIGDSVYLLSDRDLDTANRLYAAAGGSDTQREQRRVLESREEHRWPECTDVFAAWHAPGPPTGPLRGPWFLIFPVMLIALVRWPRDHRLPRGPVEVAASSAEVRVYADGVAAITVPIAALDSPADRPGRVTVDGAELWVTEFDQPVITRVLERARSARASRT